MIRLKSLSVNKYQQFYFGRQLIMNKLFGNITVAKFVSEEGNLASFTSTSISEFTKYLLDTNFDT